MTSTSTLIPYNFIQPNQSFATSNPKRNAQSGSRQKHRIRLGTIVIFKAMRQLVKQPPIYKGRQISR
jgi:hypothetical protein